MSRPRITVIALFLLAAAPFMALAADTWTVDTVHSDVSFKIRHLVAKTKGQFTDFEGVIVTDLETPENSTVEFTIDAASVDTHNADRDQHLRSEDFFHVEEHPKIIFTSSRVERIDDSTFQVTGTLEMRGQARTISFPVELLGVGPDPSGTMRAGFELETELNRKDYGITWNRALDAGGLVLGDEVEVSINLEAVRKGN